MGNRGAADDCAAGSQPQDGQSHPPGGSARAGFAGIQWPYGIGSALRSPGAAIGRLGSAFAGHGCDAKRRPGGRELAGFEGYGQ